MVLYLFSPLSVKDIKQWLKGEFHSYFFGKGKPLSEVLRCCHRIRLELMRS